MNNSSEVAPIQLNEVAPRKDEKKPSAGHDLSLVGHVKVKLDAVIGACEIPVSELMSLSKGDVVTLLAGLDDPVTLWLDERPIARGELVAVDDNFGVRIIEVL